jgi:hypothetical protein
MSELLEKEIKEEIDETESVPLTKPKKPRTAKQLEQFKKTQEKRLANIELKKKQKKIEAAKLLVENDLLPNDVVANDKVVKKNTKSISKEIVYESESESEDNPLTIEDEEQVVVRKVKPKPVKPVKPAKQPKQPIKKKKIRKIIIEESESESESESDSEDEYEYRKPSKVSRNTELQSQSKYFFV